MMRGSSPVWSKSDGFDALFSEAARNISRGFIFKAYLYLLVRNPLIALILLIFKIFIFNINFIINKLYIYLNIIYG
jgi:hypothetical protein